MKKILLLLLSAILSIGAFSACSCEDLFIDSNIDEETGEDNVDENEEKVYTVTFQQDGRQDIVKEVKEGETLTDIPQPWSGKVGYTIVWEDVSLENIRQNITVRAIERANTYTITFNGNGGTPSALTQEVTYDSVPGAFATATRENYRFSYWYHLDEDTPILPNNPWKIADDVTFTAKWVELSTESTAKEYTITFEYGDGTMQTRTVQEGGALYDFPSMGEQREGYDYAWKTLDDKDAIFSNITSDFTVKLVKTAKKYPVTFDGNGGTVMPTEIEQTYDNNYVLPEIEPTRTGYTFEGWFTEAQGGTKITDGSTVAITSDTTLYAHWTINTYPVTFMYDNNIVATQNVQHNNRVEEITTWDDFPIGQEIVDIYVNEEMTQPYDFATGVTDTLTLYVKTQAITYQITVNNDGDTSLDTTAVYNGTYALPENPTKEGYTFVGYEMNGEVFASSGKFTYTTDIVVEVIWEKIEGYDMSTVSFYDGEVQIDALTQVLENGRSLGADTLADAPEKIGYTFGGWYTNKELTTAYATQAITNNTTLYAKYTANEYDVTFDGNGGVEESTEIKQTYDSKYILPEIEPTRTGYTFEGWFTEAQGGTEITEESTVAITSDTTLYAQWTAIQSAVTFDGIDKTIDVTYDGTYGALPTASKTGYDFDGWFTAAQGGTEITEGSTVEITTDTTLYARWTAENYTLTFDASGGDAIANTVSVTYDAAVGELPTPTRAHHSFLGWNTVEDGTGSIIVEGDVWKLDNDTTLYAQWKEDEKVTITFMQSGEKVQTISLYKGDSVETLPDLTPVAGYTVTWDKSLQDLQNVQSNMEVIAELTPITYQVVLDSTDGTFGEGDIITVTVNYNDVPIWEIPTRTGYVFSGWYTSTDEYVDISKAWQRTDTELTLYAKWTAKTFTVQFEVDGEIVDTKEYYYGEDYTLFTPTNNGKRDFVGWEFNGQEFPMTGVWLYDNTETSITFVAVWDYWIGPY